MNKSRTSRHRQKGRREGGSFVAIPHAVIESPNWQNCGATAIKLLLGLAGQYRGNNNGDLGPATVKGGPASEAKAKALRELVYYGLLIQTKHGGLGMPSLYAVTWKPIDACRGKLEVAATSVAPGCWKEPRADLKALRKKKALRNPKAVASNVEPFRRKSAVDGFENRSFKASFG